MPEQETIGECVELNYVGDRIGKPAKRQGRKALGLRAVTPMIARLQYFLHRDGLQSVPLFFC